MAGKLLMGKSKNADFQTEDRPIEHYVEKLVNSESRFEQEEAANRLSRIKTRESVNAIVPLLWHDDVYIKNTVIEILQNLGEVSLPAIRELIKDEDKNIRKYALDVVKYIGSEKSLDIVFEALNDEDINVKQTAIEIISVKRSEAAVEKLMELLENENNLWILNSVIAAIGEIGAKNVNEKIEKRINSLNIMELEKNILVNTYVSVLSKVGNYRDLERVLKEYSSKYEIAEEGLINCILGIIKRYGLRELDDEIKEKISRVFSTYLQKCKSEDVIEILQVSMQIRLYSFISLLDGILERFSSGEFFEEHVYKILTEGELLPYWCVEEMLCNKSYRVNKLALALIYEKKLDGFQELVYEKFRFYRQNKLPIKYDCLRIISDVSRYVNEEILRKEMTDNIDHEGNIIALKGLLKNDLLSISEIKNCLVHSSDEVSKMAAKKLLSRNDINYEELVKIVIERRDSSIIDVLETVFDKDSKKAGVLFESVIDVDNEDVRKRLVFLLERFEDVYFYNYARIYANDPSPSVRKNLIKTLIKRRSDLSKEILLELLENETSLTNKYEILGELYKYPGKKTNENLIQYLDGEEDLLKLAAIKSIGNIAANKEEGYIELCESIKKYADSDIDEVRESIKEILLNLEV